MHMGAFVYLARNEEEMELLLEELGMVVVGAPAESGPEIEAFGLN